MMNMQMNQLNEQTQENNTAVCSLVDVSYTPEEIEAQNEQEKQLEQQHEKQQEELENNKQSGAKPDEQIIISDNEDIKGSEVTSERHWVYL